jgi:hypothetical protein
MLNKKTACENMIPQAANMKPYPEGTPSEQG